MIILGIETSGTVGSVALCDGPHVLACHTFPPGARHARNVMPAIDGVVRRAGLSKQDVEAVAVSAGPGSFTGLRVGITCAKTLAWALGWRAVPVPSLEVRAWNVDPAAWGGCTHTCPVFDARRDKVYGTLFEWDGGRWTDTTGVLLKEPAALAELLPEGTLVFGSGVQAYEEVFAGGRFRLGGAELAIGRAEAVVQLGLRWLSAGGEVDPMELSPRYYRLTAPEEKAASSPGTTQEKE